MNLSCRPSRSAMLLLALTLAPVAGSAQEQPAAGADMQAFLQEGGPLYLKNCRPCHGSKGTAGVPLAGNEKVASADWLVNTILTGPGYMPEFAPALSDEQIAAIATFVMNSWGNEYGPATPDMVAALR